MIENKIREIFSKFLAIERDRHQIAAERYDELIKELVPEFFETGNVDHLTDKDQHLPVRIVERENGTVFYPTETLGIRADASSIQGFLVPRIGGKYISSGKQSHFRIPKR